MSEHDTNGGVRVTSQRIYDLVMEVRDEVREVKQSVRDNVNPTMATHSAEIKNLRENKADKAETAKLDGAINSVRIQTYSIGAGVIAGLIALRTLGVI